MGSCITMPLPNIPTRIPTYDERKIRVIQTQIRKYLTKKRILASIKTTQQNEDFILIDPTEHDDRMNSDAPTDLPLIKITNAINGQSIKAQAHLSKTCQVQEGHCLYLESSSDRQKHDRNSSTKRIPTGESGSTYINNNDVGKEITQTQDYQVECAKSQIIGNLIPYEVCIGTEQYPDGSSYQGEFKKGLKWGYGVFKNADGSYYEGQFENDLFHGYGKFFWPNNSKIYEGFWQYGCKHGQGSLIWKDGKEYKGNYQNDIKNGFGEMRFNDGRIYKGYWLNGLQHGDGLFINPKGVETQGVWKEGRLIKF